MSQATAPGSSPDTAGQSCFHCGLPVPPGSSYGVRIDGQERAMCCRGCQAGGPAVVDGGLTDFYRYRTEQSRTGAGLVPEETCAACNDISLRRPETASAISS